MVNRPSEEEERQLIVKNLLPISHSAHYFPNFKALIGAGTEVEDARKSGAMEEVKPLAR